MFDKTIKEIIFFELPGDRVRYISNELEYPISCSIKKFLRELIDSRVDIKPRFGFLRAVHTFEPICLNLETGAWYKVDTSFIKDESTEHKLTSVTSINKNLKKYLEEKNSKNNDEKLNKFMEKVKNLKDKIIGVKKEDDKQ